MGNIYLIDYSVKGIKTIDEWASFQFYKKTITKSFSIKNYNVKGIYGANGSGILTNAINTAPNADKTARVAILVIISLGFLILFIKNRPFPRP